MSAYAPRPDRSLPDSVSFVAALLVEFPQFASARFDPKEGTLQVALLVARRVPARQRAAFCRRLEDAVAVLHDLEGGPPPRAEVRWQVGPNFTRFEIVRSVDDLTLEELRVAARMGEEAFGSDLVAGERPEDEEGRPDELRYALEHARSLRPGRPVVGVRERGKVLVYYAVRPARRIPER
jgi:hypothetical protein